jgi:hypothetical protein
MAPRKGHGLMTESDCLLESIADVRANMDFRIFELKKITGLEQEDLLCDEGMLLKGEFLRRVVIILADRYIQNPEQAHLKKYLKMKLDMDIGL